MVKVVGPMLSLSASGSISGDLTFQCGEIVRKKKFKNSLSSGELNPQQEKMKEAAEYWSKTMTVSQKAEWRLYAIRDSFNVMCGHFAFALPFLGLISISALIAGVIPFVWLNGYPLYQSYYLTLGASGWPNFPNPPPVGWKP
jgi:hypothetical protein